MSEATKRYYAALKSIAAYTPKRCVDNDELATFVDTSDEWIVQRTGIKTRYFSAKDEYSSTLGARAGLLAIHRAGIAKEDVDLVLLATLSPDFIGMPSTACLCCKEMGIENIPAFDITAACSGFIYLLDVAKAYIECGKYKNILIIGTEAASKYLDFDDRTVCVLFGDGAGAAIISRTEDIRRSILDVNISANGNYDKLLAIPVDKPAIVMRGNETFKLAVNTLSNAVKDIMEANSIEASAVRYFIPHQANLRIINAVGKYVHFTKEQIVLTVAKYGNTSAASIPMAMSDLYEAGALKGGDLMLLDAFGGGVTWGASLVYFDGK